MSSFFSAAEVNPNGDFDLIAPGEYPAIIASSEYKGNKAGTGHYMNLQVEIIDGPCKGRKLFDIVNIDNPNETAQRIAMQTVSAIAHAVNREDFVANTVEELAAKFQEFHYKPLTIEVKTESSSGYADKSVIKKYKASSAAGATQPATQAATGTTPPPWKRNQAA